MSASPCVSRRSVDRFVLGGATGQGTNDGKKEEKMEVAMRTGRTQGHGKEGMAQRTPVVNCFINF